MGGIYGAVGKRQFVVGAMESMVAGGTVYLYNGFHRMSESRAMKELMKGRLGDQREHFHERR